MSATDILAPGRTDVIPGYTLSPPGFCDYAEIEDTFSRAHVAIMIGGAADAGLSFEDSMNWADKATRARPFPYGDVSFKQKMLTRTGIAILLFFLLREKHPDITLAKTKKLITLENYLEVRHAVIDMWGFTIAQKKTPAKTSPPSTIGTSSGDSGSSETATQTSAA